VHHPDRWRGSLRRNIVHTSQGASTGPDVFLIAAADTSAERPVRELMAQYSNGYVGSCLTMTISRQHSVARRWSAFWVEADLTCSPIFGPLLVRE